ncbi:MAG: hypothetical protein H6R10_3474 [Rhodocyclaceae bacterium]|nr:hypothetical protein [Rhodocyclaceae bacterium]
MTPAITPDDILGFWFGPATDNLTVAQQQSKLWWSKNDELDVQIRQRFEPLLISMVNGKWDGFPDSAKGRLAKIILFDQFPRNMYRGTEAAFATDLLAQHLTMTALTAGDEGQLRPIERVFLYMPFEHAEEQALQDLSVKRFELLLANAREEERDLFKGYLDFAIRHRDIIERFGRFPHRNALLGRQSTPAEIEFLKEPGSSF